MFDTIIMQAYIHLDSRALQQAETFTFQKDGVNRTKYKLKTDGMKLTYRDYTQTLEVELSIPKFLYGDNVSLLKESDIPHFFQRLQERLRELFDVEIDKEDWYTKRIDVCWNFDVQEHVDDYVKQLTAMRIPYTRSETYGKLETAVHRNKSRRISFYNKQKECKRQKQPREIIESAKGLLRMEINLRDKALTKYSAKRQATKLLSREFFDYITQPILKQLDFLPDVEGLTLQWLRSRAYPIQQIERALAFKELHKWFAAAELKDIYSPSTYDKRKKLAREIQFPQRTSLAPLQIDYENLA